MQEFSKQVSNFLPDHEAIELFKAIDHDGNNYLTSDEINYELAGINAAMILNKVKEAAVKAKMTALDFFETFDNDRNDKMTIDEFDEFIKHAAEDTDKATVEYIFKLIDSDNKGHISKEDLKRVLEHEEEVLKSATIITPIDVLLPLGHTIKNRLGNISLF